MPPWEITGEKLTRWRRVVWQMRDNVYYGEISDKRRKQMEQIELKRLQSG